MGLESIDFGSIGRGVRSVEDYQDLANTRKINKLMLLGQQQKNDEYTRNNAEREALRGYLSGGVDLGTTDGFQGLYRAAPGLADGVLKAHAERSKAASEVGYKTAQTQKETIESTIKATALHRDQLAGVNDPATAARWVQAGYADPLLKPVFERGGTVEDAVGRIPQDPTAFQQWKQQNALGATKWIEQSKPTFQTRNLGGRTDTLALPGLGGPATVVNSSVNTQSPDNAATVANAARTAGMVDARMRDATSQQYNNAAAGRAQQQSQFDSKYADGGAPAPKPEKPMSASVMKLQDGYISRLDGLASINQKLAAVLADIDSGKLKPGMVNNAPNIVRNALNMSSAESRAYDNAQKTIMNLVNESLLLNKGTQTEGDAQRAAALFPNLRDGAVLRERLQGMLEVNQTGLDAAQRDVERLRDEYNKKPLDFSKYRPPGAGAGAAAAGNSVTLPNGQVKVFPSAEAAAAFRKAAGL